MVKPATYDFIADERLTLGQKLHLVAAPFLHLSDMDIQYTATLRRVSGQMGVTHIITVKSGSDTVSRVLAGEPEPGTQIANNLDRLREHSEGVIVGMRSTWGGEGEISLNAESDAIARAILENFKQPTTYMTKASAGVGQSGDRTR